MRFYLADTAAELASLLAGYARTATVEAEYGEVVVDGTVVTLAHHGARSNNPCPCTGGNWPEGCVLPLGDGGNYDAPDGYYNPPQAVGLSHIDLDALGGCLRLLGRKPEETSFWRLAASVDVRGPHWVPTLLSSGDASREDVARLNAWWAWSRDHRVSAGSGGGREVTAEVAAAEAALLRILAGDDELLARGDAFAAASEALNVDSFVSEGDAVIARRHSQFTNALYAHPRGCHPAVAVVAFNDVTGAVTVSFADQVPPGGARKIVQDLWGDLAGGREGIAGSPRDRRMTEEDFSAAVDATRTTVREWLKAMWERPLA